MISPMELYRKSLSEAMAACGDNQQLSAEVKKHSMNLLNPTIAILPTHLDVGDVEKLSNRVRQVNQSMHSGGPRQFAFNVIAMLQKEYPQVQAADLRLGGNKIAEFPQNIQELAFLPST